jgi:hypothetical protein
MYGTPELERVKPGIEMRLTGTVIRRVYSQLAPAQETKAEVDTRLGIDVVKERSREIERA